MNDIVDKYFIVAHPRFSKVCVIFSCLRVVSIVHQLFDMMSDSVV